MEDVKVFLVDDHAILIDGIRTILEKQSTISVVGFADSPEKALAALENAKPDILITDYNMPGMDGLSFIREVKSTFPEIRIIVLSMHDETRLVKSVLKEGVNGYLLKSDSHKELLFAIKCILNDDVYLSQQINKIMMNALKYPDEDRLLTDREREIVVLIAQELNNRQIAEKLFISERTVETHRKNILKKTNTSSAVGLLKFAYENGIV